MSDAVSVLNGASSEGLNKVSDAGLKGMITLKGDLTSEPMSKAVKSAVGLAMPASGECKTGAKGAVAWMAKDELMLFCDYADADKMVEKLEKALKGEHFLAVNVSDARALFKIEGDHILDILAKGTPTPLDGVVAGQFRRSRIGQIAAAFWMVSYSEAYIVCFRSVGEHMFAWLKTANNAEAALDLFSS
ncbi:MAG: sarcosine oxidase subunit gamma family protein [Pseudomonadota bacterium]